MILYIGQRVVTILDLVEVINSIRTDAFKIYKHKRDKKLLIPFIISRHHSNCFFSFIIYHQLASLL